MWVYFGWSKYPRLKSTVFTGCLLTFFSQIPDQFPDKLIKFHTSNPQKEILWNKIKTNSKLFWANIICYFTYHSCIWAQPDHAASWIPLITALIGLLNFSWVFLLTNFRLNNNMTKGFEICNLWNKSYLHCHKV